MRRTNVLILIAFAVFVVLGVGLLLARALSATGSERARVLAIVQAQARGDARRVLALSPACAAQPACAANTREFVARLKRPGAVEILQYRPSTNVTLVVTIGTGRVAWRAGTSLPIVQCVRVQRKGPLTRDSVAVLSISAPIGNEASCPP